MSVNQSPSDPPHEVRSIHNLISEAFNRQDPDGRRVGDAQHGIYLFYDYDKEPIYVGKTYEKLRVRIRRHLTNQRTDAVAMSVLDPFEVAEIEMWPAWELEQVSRREAVSRLADLEWSVYRQVLNASVFGALLNEKDIPVANIVDLPESYRQFIVPEDIRRQRIHPDIRIARRAHTIANLAQRISERSVSTGLRRTLIVQAQRLEHLARERHNALIGPCP